MENADSKAQEAQQQGDASGQDGSAPPPPGFAPYTSPPPYPTEPPAYYPPLQAEYGPPPPHPTLTTMYGNRNQTGLTSETIHLQPTSTTGRPGTRTIIVTPAVALGSAPIRTECPHCHADITTRVTYESGMMTHLCCMVICCCLWWPCACIPYLTDCAKDAVHSCPNCKKYIGTHQR